MATIYANDCPTITLEPTEESVQVLERKLSETLDMINSLVCETNTNEYRQATDMSCEV